MPKGKKPEGSPQRSEVTKGSKQVKVEQSKKEVKNGIEEGKKTGKKTTKGVKGPPTSSTSNLTGKFVVLVSLLVVFLSIGAYLLLSNQQDGGKEVYEGEYSVHRIIGQGIKSLREVFGDGIEGKEETEELPLTSAPETKLSDADDDESETGQVGGDDDDKQRINREDEETVGEVKPNYSETEHEDKFPETESETESDGEDDDIIDDERVEDADAEIPSQTESESREETVQVIKSDLEDTEQETVPTEEAESESETHSEEGEPEIQTETETTAEDITETEYATSETDIDEVSREIKEETESETKTRKEQPSTSNESETEPQTSENLEIAAEPEVGFDEASLLEDAEVIAKIGDLKPSEFYKLIGDNGRVDYEKNIAGNEALHKYFKEVEETQKDESETVAETQKDESETVAETQKDESETVAEELTGEVEAEIIPQLEVTEDRESESDRDEDEKETPGKEIEEDGESNKRQILSDDNKDTKVRDEEEEVEQRHKSDDDFYISDEDSDIIVIKETQGDLEVSDRVHRVGEVDHSDGDLDRGDDQDEKLAQEDEIEQLGQGEGEQLGQGEDAEKLGRDDKQEEEEIVDQEEDKLNKEVEKELGQGREGERGQGEDSTGQGQEKGVSQEDEEEIGENEKEDEEEIGENEKEDEEAGRDQDEKELGQDERELGQDERELGQDERELSQDGRELGQEGRELGQDGKELGQDEGEEKSDQEEKLDKDQESTTDEKELGQDEQELGQDEQELGQPKTEDLTEEASRDEQETEGQANQKLGHVEVDPDLKEEEKIAREVDEKVEKAYNEIGEKIAESARGAVNFYHSKLLNDIDDPLAAFGKAKALAAVAEEEGLPSILEDALDAYFHVLSQRPFSRKFSFMVAFECVRTLQVIEGQESLIRETLISLLDMYPNDLEDFSELALNLLKEGHFTASKTAFRLVLEKDPINAFARVYLGSLLKIDEREYQASVDLMLPVLESGQVEIQDPRIYLELADALRRLGRHDEAKHVYETAAEKGVLISPWQHSVRNIPGLTNTVWWTKEQLSEQNQRLFSELENYWYNVLEEVKGIVGSSRAGLFTPIDEDEAIETGAVGKLSLFAFGKRNVTACENMPATCRMIQNIPDVAECQHCQAHILIIDPDTRYSSHMSPTNCRIRADLGLALAPTDLIFVRGERSSWLPGRFLFYDPSFDRKWILQSEAEHLEDESSSSNQKEGTALPGNKRAILSLDMWHPDLSDELKKTLDTL